MGKNETTRVRRTFTPQFKRNAVKLMNEGKSVSEVARNLGIARSLLQRWRDRSVGEGVDAAEADEIRRNAKSMTLPIEIADL